MPSPYDIYPAVDLNYNFPPEVRNAAANSAELKLVMDTNVAAAIASNKVSPAFTGTPTVPDIADTVNTQTSQAVNSRYVFGATSALKNGNRLGDTAQDITGSNLNDLKTTGFYKGNSLVNAPASSSNDWYYVIVVRHDDTYVWQQLHHYFNTYHFERRLDNGNWQPWRKIFKEKDPIGSGTNLDQVTDPGMYGTVAVGPPNSYGYGMLIVARSGNIISQQYFEDGGERLHWFRESYNSGNNWTQWTRPGGFGTKAVNQDMLNRFNPNTGSTILRDDGYEFRWNGSQYETWNSNWIGFFPNFSGAGSTYNQGGRYRYVSGKVRYEATLVIGNGGSQSGEIWCYLPINASQATTFGSYLAQWMFAITGRAGVYRPSNNGRFYDIAIRWRNPNAITFNQMNSAQYMDGLNSLGSNDELYLVMEYDPG